MTMEIIRLLPSVKRFTLTCGPQHILNQSDPMTALTFNEFPFFFKTFLIARIDTKAVANRSLDEVLAPIIYSP